MKRLTVSSALAGLTVYAVGRCSEMGLDWKAPLAGVVVFAAVYCVWWLWDLVKDPLF